MSAQTIESPATARQAVSLPAHVWRDALAATLLSVGKDDTLPTLETVHVSVDESQVALTSTDRYRLTRVTVPLSSSSVAGAVAPFTALLPSGLVKRMHALTKASKANGGLEPFTLSIEDDGHVAFTGAWSGSVTGMIEPGEYPRVDGIINRATDSKINPGPHLMDGRLTLGFDPRYMADLCKMPRERSGGKNARPAAVALSIGDPDRPLVAKWQLNGADYLYVLMPACIAS